MRTLQSLIKPDQWFKFIVLSTIALIISKGMLLSLIGLFYNGNPIQQLEYFQDTTPMTLFVKTVLLVPFIETLVYQALLISIINALAERQWIKYVSTGLSAIVFGLSHGYDIIYILSSTYAGLFLAIIFNYSGSLIRNRHPFLTVWYIHALHNLIVFLVTLMKTI